MGLNFEYSDGQTPIEEEEREGLKIKTISTKDELDEFEQQNIEEATLWLIGRKVTPSTLFSLSFMQTLHKRMYGNVWNWAGKFRTTEKNLGIKAYQITQQLKQLCDDGLYWYQYETYPPKELAIRFKHKLVSIHCFANGNGRHSRLMADLILEKLFKLEPFSWGEISIKEPSKARSQYLKAIKKADVGDFKPLLRFAET